MNNADYARLRALLPGLPIGVSATTVNAATVTADTGYQLPLGHSAKLDGGLNVNDATAATTGSKNINAALKNFSGTPTVAGLVVGGFAGDGALTNATVTFSFSNGTLHVTFTPPGGYSGTLNWSATINPSLN